MSPAERRRLAALLAAAATPLLLLFVFSLALPLLPLKLADPTWQLALCGGLASSGALALLAVLLVQLGAALDPDTSWLQRRRRWMAGVCRWISVAFLLLIPLQGWAAWHSLEQVSRHESREAHQSLDRIARFRQAVTRADSVASLQANLAVINAPPLSPDDQIQGLPALRASMLSQLNDAEQKARRASAVEGAMTSGRASNMQRFLWLDSLRVVLLSVSLSLGFAAAGQRRGSGLSQRNEWRLAAADGVESFHRWRDGRFGYRKAGRRGPGRGPSADAAYFELLADEEDTPLRR